MLEQFSMITTTGDSQERRSRYASSDSGGSPVDDTREFSVHGCKRGMAADAIHYFAVNEYSRASLPACIGLSNYRTETSPRCLGRT